MKTIDVIFQAQRQKNTAQQTSKANKTTTKRTRRGHAGKGLEHRLCILLLHSNINIWNIDRKWANNYTNIFIFQPIMPVLIQPKSRRDTCMNTNKKRMQHKTIDIGQHYDIHKVCRNIARTKDSEDKHISTIFLREVQLLQTTQNATTVHMYNKLTQKGVISNAG